jgi:hypothetical protein
MPQRAHKSKPAFDLAEAQRLYDQGLSYRKVAEQLGSNYAAVYRALTAASTNGDAETTVETVAETVDLAVRDTSINSSLQPIVQPVVQTIVPRLDDHESRIHALETLLATFQQRHELTTPTLQTTARLHTEPARPRSIQMETDLFDTLKAFCKAEHRQMKEVLDTALCTFFASHGWTIMEGDRDA